MVRRRWEPWGRSRPSTRGAPTAVACPSRYDGSSRPDLVRNAATLRQVVEQRARERSVETQPQVVEQRACERSVETQPQVVEQRARKRSVETWRRTHRPKPQLV